MASAASNLEAKQLRLQAANDGYRLAVQEYSAAIEHRRAEMARIGAAADKKIDRRGRETRGIVPDGAQRLERIALQQVRRGRALR